MNVDSLLSTGFVSVEYPRELRLCVIRATESWERFCNLPTETKLLLSKGDREKDFGYMLRNDTADDPKELFHLLGNNVDELRRMAGSISDSRALEFIESGDAMIRAMVPLIREFARQVEARFGLVGFENETMNCQKFWTFRFLHYFGSPMLAMAHADRGGFTLHNYESESGGEYLNFQGKWRPWPVSEKETIIFPGMCLQYRSESQLKALWHRVTSTPQSQTHGRYAMVTFIDFASGMLKPVKRLQDMPEGFNYKMSFDELKQFMIPA